MSVISPFSEEACFTCSRFTKTEVEDLLKQFAADTNENFSFIDIAADICVYTNRNVTVETLKA